MQITTRTAPNCRRSGRPRTALVATGPRGIASAYLPANATPAQIVAATVALVARYTAQRAAPVVAMPHVWEL